MQKNWARRIVRFSLVSLRNATWASLAIFGLSASTAQAEIKSVTLTEGTNISVSAAPDRSRAVFDLQSILWIVPLKGGVAKPITDWKLEALRPVWSPRGDLIAFQAFSEGAYHIWTVRPDGKDLKQWTDGFYDDREPVWSPDGSKLAFCSDRAGEGSFDIWTIDAANSHLTRLTADKSDEFQPVWSPDGRAIAFVQDGRSVVSISASGGDRRVMATVPGKITTPVWLPDNSGVVAVESGRAGGVLYSRLQGPTAPISQGEDVFPTRPQFLSADEILYAADGGIRIRNLKTGAKTQVPFSATHRVNRPVWRPMKRDFSSSAPHPVKGLTRPRLSPDGKAAVFVALGDVYIARPGQKPEAITNDLTMQGEPSWSPDGTAVLYTSDKAGPPAIYRFDLATRSEKSLTTGPNAAYAGKLSPDGSKLAFLDEVKHIHIMDLRSGQVRAMAEPSAPDMGPPTWSSDGRHVAYNALERLNTRFREGQDLIHVLDIETKSIRLVSPGEHASIADRMDSGPAWSPNGQWFAYIRESVLWVLPVNADGTPNGAPRRLTTEAADSPSWSGDSKALLYIHHGQLKTVDLDGRPGPGIPVDLTWSNEVSTGTKIIHAGRFWDGKSAAPLTNVDIVVRNDRIESVRPHRDAPESGATLIDASNQTVLPGLIDLHIHPETVPVYQTRFWPLFLSMGVTSVMSAGGNLNEEISKREALAAGRLAGPRLFAAGELIDGYRQAGNPTRVILSDAQMALEIDREVALQPDFIKTYLHLDAPKTDMVAAAARRAGIATGSHYLWSGISSGETFTTHLSTQTRMDYSETASDVGKSYSDVFALYTQTDFTMTYTPDRMNIMLGLDPAMLDDPRVQSLYSAADLNRMRQSAATPPTPQQLAELTDVANFLKGVLSKGGKVAVATDTPTPALIPGISLHFAARAMALGAITPLDVLKSLTSIPAEMLGVGNDLGALQPGKLADLIIVDGNPLTDIKDLYKVAKVMKGGNLYSQAQILAGFPPIAPAQATARP